MQEQILAVMLKSTDSKSQRRRAKYGNGVWDKQKSSYAIEKNMPHSETI